MDDPFCKRCGTLLEPAHCSVCQTTAQEFHLENKITSLEAENERLREALEYFVREAKALGTALQRLTAAAGFKGAVQVHGLRANAAGALAEAGCSPHEIAAVTGHKSLRMVQHYSRGAEQKARADRAIDRLENESGT